jgi:hypothetical protein
MFIWAIGDLTLMLTALDFVSQIGAAGDVLSFVGPTGGGNPAFHTCSFTSDGHYQYACWRGAILVQPEEEIAVENLASQDVEVYMTGVAFPAEAIVG